MNVLKAIFCCYCCNESADDDDFYKRSYRVRIEEHFNSEIRDLRTRRTVDMKFSTDLNKKQI